MKAFSRSAHLTKRYFPNPEHRKFIMDQVILATTILDEEVLKYSFDALNDIVKEAYDFISEDIERIGEATLRLINSEFTAPAMLAIEIWATIADVEI